MRHPGHSIAAVTLALVMSACQAHRWSGELWLWSASNLADNVATARTAALWRRAAAAGYTTVVLTDAKFSRLATQDAPYFARLGQLRALADSLRLELVPALLPVGRGQGATLAVNPNLAEALPVRGALFEVRDGVAQLIADPPVALGTKPDRRGAGIKLAGGVLAARDPWLPARASWSVRVSPWRCYHLAVQVRTQDFSGEPSAKVRAHDREIAFADIQVARSQPWTTHHVVFNSRGDSSIRIVLGTNVPARGLLEWRAWRLEECGPVNLVRRADTPFAAEGLVEGRDFEPVRDSLMGNSPWRGQFTAWHEPPRVRVHRPDATRFRASWYHAPVLVRGQVAVCLSDSTALAQVADEITRVRAAFQSRTVLLMHDEIRTLGWDPACVNQHRTPGAMLAEHLRFCRGLLAGTRVCVWNDMFDPTHNAVREGWLVNGNLSGSWAGLDSSVVVLNWNSDRLPESLAFFASRHMRQVYAGNFEGDLRSLSRSLPVLARTSGVFAIMYTTWQDRYENLETFARLARRGRRGE